MDVVCEIPIGVVVLRRQAVCIYSGVDGPGMNFREWKVFIYEGDAVSIFLQQLRKHGLVHARERFAIFGKQEIVSLLLIATLKRDGQRVVIWKFAGLERTQVDLYSCWDAVERTHLPLNTLGNF